MALIVDESSFLSASRSHLNFDSLVRADLVQGVKRTGGEGGIRTPDTLSGMPVFKTGAINHSATSPDATVPPANRDQAGFWLVYNSRNHAHGDSPNTLE